VSASVDQAAALPVSRLLSSAPPAPFPRRTGFIGMARAHLLLGNRLVSAELKRARSAAVAIADPSIRRAALRALAKRGNVEGAALLATVSPPVHRRTALHAVIAFQIAYNHLDAVAELDSDDPPASSRRLHQALLAAVQPHEPHVDYYEHARVRADGGYLLAMLERCRRMLLELPSFALVAPSLLAAAERIREFQALNLPQHQGGQAELRAYSEGVARQFEGVAPPLGRGLSWSESAAACGSSLPVHALLAAAADPLLDAREAAAIEAVYVPWGGALHSLLDSLVDREEDRAQGLRSLYECYASGRDAAEGLASLARAADRAAVSTAAPNLHRAILAAMCSYYLSAPRSEPTAQAAARARLLEVNGASLRVALALFALRRLGHGLARGEYV
jgi:tetraprenyl-beta-curcumene synthase